MIVKQIHNEHELLQSIANRDARAFSDFYYHFHRKVFTFSLRLLKSEIQAEEVVQEVFLKIWNLETTVTEIINIDAYLKTLARNRSMDILRRAALEARNLRSQQQNWTEAHNETEELLILNDTRKIIEKGVALLPAQQRKVYEMCHQQGMKYEEVATQLNISYFTVQTHMKLALKFLRNYLKNHSDLAGILIILKIL